MKRIALILAVVLVASLSLEAQNRSSKNKEVKKESRNREAKKSSTKSVKKSSKSTVKYNSPSKNSQKASNSRKASSSRKANSSQKAYKSQRAQDSRKANRSHDAKSSRSRTAVKSPSSSKTSKRYKHIEGSNTNVVHSSPGNSHHNSAVNSHHRNVKIKSPRHSNRGYHHGYVESNHHHYGYNHHDVVFFPRRVQYNYWPGHHVMLYASYMPEQEYPWAIYEAEDRMACIEGVVVDFDYDRRSGQYILHFGRHEPFQSASVVIPRHLSKYLSRRSIRKLRNDYVSVCGAFNDFGNVPTVKVFDLDQIYVNEIPFQEYLMYYQ